MAPQFALSRDGPKEGLQPGPASAWPVAGDERRPNRRHIVASLLFHLLILVAIFLLPRAVEPLEVVVPLVTLKIEESGAAGSAGGKAGGGGGGHGSEASSAPTQQKSTEQKTAEAETTPSEPPTPPTPPTPPVPEASPLPPAPHALAPPPKPRPRPVVRPQPPAAKPAPPVAAKPTPIIPPLPTPTTATQPPPGPGTGQGAASNPQQGTAATGMASAGPGGATGIGTGTGGAGRGAFGNGKGPGDDYLDRLRRWVAKFKRYPPEAVKRKQEGTVLVTFVLARDGTVLEAEIARGSGFPLLDQAALDMMRNASRVPPLPPSFDGDQARLTMPVGFSIGLFDRLF